MIGSLRSAPSLPPSPGQLGDPGGGVAHRCGGAGEQRPGGPLRFLLQGDAGTGPAAGRPPGHRERPDGGLERRVGGGGRLDLRELLEVQGGGEEHQLEPDANVEANWFPDSSCGRYGTRWESSFLCGFSGFLCVFAAQAGLFLLTVAAAERYLSVAAQQRKSARHDGAEPRQGARTRPSSRC